jgi:hypothetical protein
MNRNSHPLIHVGFLSNSQGFVLAFISLKSGVNITNYLQYIYIHIADEASRHQRK